jgi:ATP-dependent Clp protease ATP-binding subunit ClpA
MLVFSQNLSRSLSRAIAMAEQQSYQCATPEHVLLALLDDPDAIPVLEACNVAFEKLRSAVLASMPHWPYTQDEGEPEAKAAQVMELARRHQHPLRCRVLE